MFGAIHSPCTMQKSTRLLNDPTDRVLVETVSIATADTDA